MTAYATMASDPVDNPYIDESTNSYDVDNRLTDENVVNMSTTQWVFNQHFDLLSDGIIKGDTTLYVRWEMQR